MRGFLYPQTIPKTAILFQIERVSITEKGSLTYTLLLEERGRGEVFLVKNYFLIFHNPNISFFGIIAGMSVKNFNKSGNVHPIKSHHSFAFA
jgi:hypothetical protein